MKNLQIVYFLFLLHHCSCQNYTQTKNLLDDDKLVLHYEVEDQQFKFKLVGKAGEQMGLAFTYDVSHQGLQIRGEISISISGLPSGWVRVSGGRECSGPHTWWSDRSGP